jgi:hypothetical protein
LDRLIAEARAGRLGAAAHSRSVVGTIDLPADDPKLSRADSTVRELFAESIARPLQVRNWAQRRSIWPMSCASLAIRSTR